VALPELLERVGLETLTPDLGVACEALAIGEFFGKRSL
jgi:hypothetical protein